MATQKITIEEMGSKLRAKFPNRFNPSVTDAQIGQLFIQKNPRFSSFIDAPTRVDEGMDAQKVSARLGTPSGVTPTRSVTAPRGALGFGTGVVKSFLDAPRQFAELGQRIGTDAARSSFGQVLGRAIAESTPGRALRGLFGQEGLEQVQRGLEAGVEETELTKARTGAERTGKFAGEIAQIALPGAGTARLGKLAAGTAKTLGAGQRTAKVLGTGTRVATEAIGEGLFVSAQTQSVPEGIKEAGVSTAIQSAFLGAGGVLRGAARIANKVISKGDEATPFLREIAERRGVQLTPAALKDNKVIALLEGSAAKGFGGRKLVEKVNKSIDDIANIGEETLQKLGGATDPFEAGEVVARGIKKADDNFFKTASEMYSVLPKSGPNSLQAISVIPTETVAKLDDIIDTLRLQERVGGTVPELKRFEKIKRGLVTRGGDPKSLKASELRALVQNLNKQLKFGDEIATGAAAQLRGLRHVAKTELDEGISAISPEIAKQLSDANAFYAETLDILNSRVIKRIRNNIDRPDVVFRIITQPSTSVTDVERIMQFAADDADVIRSAFINEALKKATSAATDEISGTTLAKLLRRFGPRKLNAILTPQQLGALEDMAELSKAVQRTGKITEGSQTAFLNRIMLTVGAAFLNPVMALKIVAADTAFGKILFSERGQRFLIDGIDQNTIDGLQTIAERAGRTVSPAVVGATADRED